jgi:hypothetical protein
MKQLRATLKLSIFFVPFILMACKPAASDVSQAGPAEPAPVSPVDPQLKGICTESQLVQIESDIKNSLAKVATNTDFSIQGQFANSHFLEIL